MAGRKCTICDHPKRKDIDRECTRDGAILRTIANHFALSESSLKRHVSSGHIAAKIANAVKAQEIVEADNLLNEVQEVQKITEKIIKDALDRKRKIDTETGIKDVPDPDHPVALKAVDTRGKQIELKCKILGVFREKIEHSGSLSWKEVIDSAE
jgi:hypothetical protein